MARRLLDPAHLRDLARRSAATLREQGAEQLWRDVTFRVGLAFHHDDWRHRADPAAAPHPESPAGGGPAGALHQRGGAGVQHARCPSSSRWCRACAARPMPTGSWCWWTPATKPTGKFPAGRGSMPPGTAASFCRKVENRGIAANTTEGFAAASGDYLALLDHDDVLYPNALFECVQVIQKTGADFVYSDEIVLSADLKKLGRLPLQAGLCPRLSAGRQLHHPSGGVQPRPAGPGGRL